MNTLGDIMNTLETILGFETETTLGAPARANPLETVLEIRSTEAREITGRIVPYGQAITVKGRREAFARGAFAGVNPADVKLLDHHGRPLGRMLDLEERDDGAWGTFRIAATAAGDEMLTLVSEGVVTGLSVGFVPGTQARDGTHTRVARLPEVSLVTWPAYETAQVVSVRERERDDMPDTDYSESAEVDLAALDGLQTRMDDLFANVQRLAAAVESNGHASRPALPTPFRWFAAQVASEFRNDPTPLRKLEAEWSDLRERALEDITGAFPENVPADDLSALVVEEFVASQLVNVLDVRRPLFRNAGSFPMPRSGYARIPIVTQHTEVAARAGQKLEANSRKMVVTTESFEAGWLDGAVDVALELIRTAELPVLSMVWEDMLSMYALATENDPTHGIVAKVEAGIDGADYTGTALDTSSYADFVTDVITGSMAVRKATAMPASRLAVTEAQWPTILSMVDANGRRILSTSGAQNADASATFTADEVTLPGGISAFWVEGLTQAVLFNEAALRVADGGPERVEAVNVAQMGRDIGVLGRTMVVPRIPAGIVVFGTEPV